MKRTLLPCTTLLCFALFANGQPQSSVGPIGGSMAVTPTGAAIYQIPTSLPPGVNGVQPDVQLTYNSQTGNGIAGIGFSLSAGSSITRTGSNLFDDGATNPILLTDADNLSLEGTRLILVKGKNLADGAKYRTQEERYSDITYHKIDEESHFEVVSQAGMTMLYGATDDSRIEAQGTRTPTTWALKK